MDLFIFIFFYFLAKGHPGSTSWIWRPSTWIPYEIFFNTEWTKGFHKVSAQQSTEGSIHNNFRFLVEFISKFHVDSMGVTYRCSLFRSTLILCKTHTECTSKFHMDPMWNSTSGSDLERQLYITTSGLWFSISIWFSWGVYVVCMSNTHTETICK